MITKIHQAFKDALINTGVFKEVIMGYIPPPSKIKKYPAIAIDFARFTKDRVNTGTCQFKAEEIVDIYV